MANTNVYYGEYSLKHWIELMITQDIVLPDYQRYFVWTKENVQGFVQSLKKGQFVPPVAIGAFAQKGKGKQNFIIDGQQRLTSILLAYLGKYPKKDMFKDKYEAFVSEDIDDDDELPKRLAWQYRSLFEDKNGEQLKKVLTIEDIRANADDELFYEPLELYLDDDFFTHTFLGFSFILPKTSDAKGQQEYFSQTFRNINRGGTNLLPLESREALYYLDDTYKDFFDPEFLKKYKTRKKDLRLDFVRYASFLSQYKKQNESADNIAKGYGKKLEDYYEKYIYSVVGGSDSSLFGKFSVVFPKRAYKSRLKELKEYIGEMGIPTKCDSIIDMDIFFFGLIWFVMFENKKMLVEKMAAKKFVKALGTIGANFRGDESQKKSPNSLKNIAKRLKKSIEEYEAYAQ